MQATEVYISDIVRLRLLICTKIKVLPPRLASIMFDSRSPSTEFALENQQITTKIYYVDVLSLSELLPSGAFGLSQLDVTQKLLAKLCFVCDCTK